MPRALAALALLAALAACASAPEEPARSGADHSDAFAPTLNAVRAQHDLAALRPAPRLAAAAETHAADMAEEDFISHDGSDGSTMQSRIVAAGYPSCASAENIALRATSRDEAIAQWLDSPAHRENVLRGGMEEFGLAEVGGYWVLKLARPC